MPHLSALLLSLSLTLSMSGQSAPIERFLVPIFLQQQPASGAFGSSWVSEFRVLYTGSSSTMIQNLGGIATDGAGFHPFILEPDRVVAYPFITIDGFSGATPGAILNVAATGADDVDFQLRIRDTSREARGWGTSIPVVSESRFSRERIHLFDVPTRHNYRWMVRIYSMSGSGNVRVRLHPVYTSGGSSFAPDPQIATISVPLSPPIANTAGYAQVTLDNFGDYSGEIARHHQFRVTVEPEGDFAVWAMVSITNNVTNEVTMIVPQR